MPKSSLETSKADQRRILAISSMVRRPSILVTSTHSWGLRVTWSRLPSRSGKKGTRSSEGIFRDSTRHSSRRRAASIIRFALDFWMLTCGGASPGVKTNSPSDQMAIS